MRSLIVLAVAALSIAACTYKTETVERRTPSGSTVVSEHASVGTPVVTVKD